MLLIDEVLVSDDIFDVHFHCDLQKCKGACCWEGDFGAPLSEKEIKVIKPLLDKVKKILPEENIKVLEQKGVSEYYKEPEVEGTPLMQDASCVYMLKDKNKVAKCAFEILYYQDKIDFKKPVSCELYPIRVLENEEIGFFALNYDVWDICKDACVLGDKLEMPVFRFLKSGLVRKFGITFYEELEAYYQHIQSKSNN